MECSPRAVKSDMKQDVSVTLDRYQPCLSATLIAASCASIVSTPSAKPDLTGRNVRPIYIDDTPGICGVKPRVQVITRLLATTYGTIRKLAWTRRPV